HHGMDQRPGQARETDTDQLERPCLTKLDKFRDARSPAEKEAERLRRENEKLAAELADLQITRSHSRPKTSNDTPYSEAAFKTLKYCPAFPEWFGGIDDARAFCEAFFTYYDHEHRHSGIGLHTPASVHFGTAEQIRAQRAVTLEAAYQANPGRFRRRPVPPAIPATAWINDPGKREMQVQNN
ncbi:integrase core domain-containing protein, partial [Streptosporangium canum]|uniref:integrase core domain-containing protein n=1 Tax=Streptosporangium canum TaxID=324952 RepID=UPI0033AF93EF